MTQLEELVLYEDLSDLSKYKICKRFGYRKTLKTGALTKTIVIDPINVRIIEPTYTERSKTGAHGWDLYCLDEETWKRVWIITVEVSNSGKRYISFENIKDESIKRELERIWLAGAGLETLIDVALKCAEIHKTANEIAQMLGD